MSDNTGLTLFWERLHVSVMRLNQVTRDVIPSCRMTKALTRQRLLSAKKGTKKPGLDPGFLVELCISI